MKCVSFWKPSNLCCHLKKEEYFVGAVNRTHHLIKNHKVYVRFTAQTATREFWIEYFRVNTFICHTGWAIKRQDAKTFLPLQQPGQSEKYQEIYLDLLCNFVNFLWIFFFFFFFYSGRRRRRQNWTERKIYCNKYTWNHFSVLCVCSSFVQCSQEMVAQPKRIDVCIRRRRMKLDPTPPNKKIFGTTAKRAKY